MQLDMILSTIRVPGASGTEKKKKKTETIIKIILTKSSSTFNVGDYN